MKTYTKIPSFILIGLLILFYKNLQAQQIPWFNNESYNYSDIHDPTVIRDNRGMYTMMSTNNLLEVVQSADLVNWTIRGKVFNNVPGWATQMSNAIEDLWAPHLVYMNGRYWAYYSASSFGSNNSGIGVASTPTLDVNAANYSWTDHGMVIQSSGQNFNAIDPEIIQDQNGSWWMAFGSFWDGIRIVQIDPTTGKRTSSSNTIHRIASRGGGAIEGPSIIYNDGYYYLFTAWDACCQGVNSTYRTMVGRSQNITGPYVDKEGRSLTNNNATQVIARYDRYIGPGGGSAFKDGRRTYFTHHYYNADQNGFPRVHFREMVWGSDGWPIFTQPYIGRRLAFEAEHAELINASFTDGTNASDGSYVANINFADSRVIFHINSLQAGNHILHIRYAAGAGNSSHFIQINNNAEIEVPYPATSNWGQFPSGQSVKVNVVLEEGYNRISFRTGTGFAELDRIDIFRSASEPLEAGSNDNGVGISYISESNNASYETGSWSHYEYIDFESGNYQNLNITAGGNCNGTVNILADSRTSTISASTSLSLTAGQTHQLALPESFSDLTNTHDLFIEYTGTQACILDKIQFSKTSVPVNDCNGDAGGAAYIDDCGTCVGGNTNKQPCTRGNPIITHTFTADPSALVHNDTVFLYVGHDEATTTSTDYVLNEWKVFSSCDMVNWTDHGSPLSVRSFNWARSHAFAGHCIERNGKFYWYVPVLRTGELFSIGVAVSDSPTGPFTDAIGAPLIADAMTPDVSYDIDPAVFIDDDGQAYLYWGNVIDDSPMKMVRLNEDMISLSGEIETANVPYFTEAPYLHKKNNTYYLSYASGWPERIVYCTGPTATGPWTYRGILNELVSSATNHQSIIEFKGKDYFIYHNSDLPTGGDYRRSVAIDYLYYNTDGTLQQIVQTTTGVDQVECSVAETDCNGIVNGTAFFDNCGVCVSGNTGFESCTDTLEAETACAADGILSETTNSGYSGNGYVNTDNENGVSVSWAVSSPSDQVVTITFKYANGGTTDRDGNIFINGVEAGLLSMPVTGTWNSWNTATVTLEFSEGINEISVVANSDQGLANIDLIYFSNNISPAECLITKVKGTLPLNDLKIYPNPTENFVYLNQPAKWELTNSLGETILQGVGREIDLSTHSSAIYFLRIENSLIKIIKH